MTTAPKQCTALFSHQRSIFKLLLARCISVNALLGKSVLLILAWGIIFASDAGRAAVLHLSNGKLVRGEIVAETSRVLHLKTPLGILSFAKSEIISVEDSYGAGESALAQQLERSFEAGKTLDGLTILQRLSISSNTEELVSCDRVVLQNFSLIENFAKTNPTLTIETLKCYLFARATPPPSALFEKTFELAVATGDTSQTATLVKIPLQRKWDQLFDRQIVEQLLELCRNTDEMPLQDRLLIAAYLCCSITGQDNESQRLLRRTIDLVAETIQQVFAQLETKSVSASRAALETVNPLEIVPREKIPELFSNLIGRAHNINTTNTQLVILSWITANSEKIPDFDYSAALIEQHKLLVEAHDFGAARQLAKQWETRSPDLAALLLLKTEFYEREAALSPTEHAARYKLAKWACEMGLTEQGLQVFRRLLSSPVVGRACYLQLRQWKTCKDAAVLEEAIGLFRQGLYSSAAEKAELIANSREKSDLTTEASLLASLAKRQAKEAPEREKYRALALLQQAERHALRGEYPYARTCLERAQQMCRSAEILAASSVLQRRFPQLADTPRQESTP